MMKDNTIINKKHACDKTIEKRTNSGLWACIKQMSLCRVQRLCTCRRREGKWLTLTFLNKFFLSATFGLDSEALLEPGSLKNNQQINIWRKNCTTASRWNWRDGILTTNDCTISKVTSELLIVSTCCTKTFLLWISTEKEGRKLYC
jgi:hypothetical protein